MMLGSRHDSLLRDTPGTYFLTEYLIDDEFGLPSRSMPPAPERLESVLQSIGLGCGVTRESRRGVRLRNRVHGGTD